MHKENSQASIPCVTVYRTGQESGPRCCGEPIAREGPGGMGGCDSDITSSVAIEREKFKPQTILVSVGQRPRDSGSLILQKMVRLSGWDQLSDDS